MNDAEGSLSSVAADLSGTDLAPSLIAAAHELKSPLVLLRQLTFQLEDEKNKETVRRMRFTTDRALRLVDNITKSACLGDAMFICEPIQLSGLCESAVDEMQPLGRELNTEIIWRSPRTPRVAIGNRELLHALLIGLIDNALHYANGKTIEVSARISGNEVILSVCDSGATVSLSEFRRLKNALGRAKMPISSRPLSSGLGLLITQKFVMAMNGRLTITRRAHGGMIFSTHLPTIQQLSLLES